MALYINELPRRTIEIENKIFLFFSGTAYLGIGHQSKFRKALSKGILKYGTIFSASRNSNLRLSIYDEAENFFAKKTGAETALTVSSGAIAGQLAINFLKNNFFIYAVGVHPAIWQSNPENIFSDEKDLKIIFEKISHEKNFEKNSEKNSDEKNSEKNFVIASNAIDPLTCSPTDWNFINSLPKNKNFTLLIDDSHGIGISGENGGGIYNKIKNGIAHLPNVKLIVVASLAKASGLPGGVILGDLETINALRVLPLFVGASPMVPAYLQAFLDTQDMYDTARKQLLKNCRFFLSFLSDISRFKLRYFPDYPVFFVKDVGIYPYLYDRGIFISQFAYPNPNDALITRLIISALHTKKDIEILADAVNDYFKEK